MYLTDIINLMKEFIEVAEEYLVAPEHDEDLYKKMVELDHKLFEAR